MRKRLLSGLLAVSMMFSLSAPHLYSQMIRGGGRY